MGATTRQRPHQVKTLENQGTWHGPAQGPDHDRLCGESSDGTPDTKEQNKHNPKI